MHREVAGFTGVKKKALPQEEKEGVREGVCVFWVCLFAFRGVSCVSAKVIRLEMLFYKEIFLPQMTRIFADLAVAVAWVLPGL